MDFIFKKKYYFMEREKRMMVFARDANIGQEYILGDKPIGKLIGKQLIGHTRDHPKIEYFELKFMNSLGEVMSTKTHEWNDNLYIV
jgi:hypothetical protein